MLIPVSPQVLVSDVLRYGARLTDGQAADKPMATVLAANDTQLIEAKSARTLRTTPNLVTLRKTHEETQHHDMR